MAFNFLSSYLHIRIEGRNLVITFRISRCGTTISGIDKSSTALLCYTITLIANRRVAVSLNKFLGSPLDKTFLPRCQFGWSFFSAGCWTLYNQLALEVLVRQISVILRPSIFFFSSHTLVHLRRYHLPLHPIVFVTVI